MQSHVVTNDLGQAQDFQRCCHYRGLGWKGRFSLYMLRQALHPHARASSCQEVLYFLQQWVYSVGFSINPVQPFAQAYFMYYST